jgi:hypothetical protein
MLTAPCASDTSHQKLIKQITNNEKSEKQIGVDQLINTNNWDWSDCSELSRYIILAEKNYKDNIGL